MHINKLKIRQLLRLSHQIYSLNVCTATGESLGNSEIKEISKILWLEKKVQGFGKNYQHPFNGSTEGWALFGRYSQHCLKIKNKTRNHKPILMIHLWLCHSSELVNSRGLWFGVWELCLNYTKILLLQFPHLYGFFLATAHLWQEFNQQISSFLFKNLNWGQQQFFLDLKRFFPPRFYLYK